MRMLPCMAAGRRYTVICSPREIAARAPKEGAELSTDSRCRRCPLLAANPCESEECDCLGHKGGGRLENVQEPRSSAFMALCPPDSLAALSGPTFGRPHPA